MAILGGHSITDPEPKYGMVVLGLVAPDAIVRNSTATAGAALVLTKPIGLGIVSTAVKRGIAPPDLIAKAVDLMTTTNQAASEAMIATQTAAATDVTGFGLLGHLHTMLLASGVAGEIDAGEVPLLDPRVLELARSGVVPGGTARNHAFIGPHTDFGPMPESDQLVLADAQTSGGLLIATRDPDGLASALASRGASSALIGSVVAGEPDGSRSPGASRNNRPHW